MFLSSMTGFAKAETTVSFAENEFFCCWEIKSVNGKSLDAKFRMPQGFDEISLGLKNILNKYFSRGSISVNLEWKGGRKEPELCLNEPWLNKLSEKAMLLYQSNPEMMQKPTVGELLSLRGVIESSENALTDEQKQVVDENLLSSFEELCVRLKKDRISEGEKIKQALLAILDDIRYRVDEISKISENIPQEQKKRLEEQIKLWLAPENQPSEERLAQELVFYITRADIKEETDRLKAHVKTAEQLLTEGGAVGRRLDFLCQELNREANTTCSKSCDIKLTNLGMELKALIEQFREQVQNIE